jgi:hypothetical protein
MSMTQTGSPLILANAIPGLRNLTTQATNVIGNALGGAPSVGETRTANAAWGAGAGIAPGSEFLDRRGYRLYRSEMENRQRKGLQDLLAMLQGYSGTVTATPGQLMDYSQRNAQNTWQNLMGLQQQQLAERQNQNQWQEFSGGAPRGSGAWSGYRYMRNPYTGQTIGATSSPW